MPTFTILSHAWTMTQHRAKPVLKPFVWTLVMLLGVVGHTWAQINVPADYATIQEAIDAAVAGQTITVDANTYTEEINLNKAVTIQGANVNISAGVPPGTRGAETIIDGGFIVSAAATLNGLQIIKGRTSGSVKVGVAVTASGVSILNCIIQDVGMVPLTSQSDGISTQPGNNNLTLTNSKIFNNWRGIYLNPGDGHTFTGNLIDANNGVGVGIGSDGQSNFTLTGNIISGHTLEGWGSSAVGANVVAEDNQFLSNGVSVAHYGGSAIDASPNYWGSANPNWGPMNPNFSGNVTYDPWWADVAMSMLESNQPVHNLTQNTYHGTISAAITAAVADDVIELDPGTYNERVVINKSLTLQGVDEATCIIDGTGLIGNGRGIAINNGITSVTIQDLTVQNFSGTNGNTDAGIYAIGGNDDLTVENVTIQNNVGGSGFYANGPVDNVTLDYVTSSGHTTGARGIVIWNGLKSNITITNCTVFNNNCCGIELQDGSCSGVTMSNNTVYDNEDNGLSAVGLNGSIGPNTISDNDVTNCGRFGIEIKNPDGSTTVSGNTIVGPTTTPTSPTNVLRDFAGIAVMRRGVLAGNVEVPTGVSVINNAVSGYVQASNSDGFGIVIEGTYHTVSGNTLTGNDVGIQLQKGHTPLPPSDGNQDNLSDQYFGRGNSQTTECNSVYDNDFSMNGVNERAVGGPFDAGFVTNDNTNATYCSIQGAIDAASPGHKLIVSPGTYTGNVTINKAIILEGANAGTSGCVTRASESKIMGAFTIAANGVTIDGFEFTGADAAIASSVGATTWSNINIKNNYIHATTAQVAIRHGLGLGGGVGTTNWTISRNKIDDIQKLDATAIALFNTTTSTIQDNCITHTNSSYNGRRGINADGLQTATISGNTIDMGKAYPILGETGPTPWAIQISMSDRDATGITMTDNIVKNTYYGVVGLSQRNVTGFTASCNEFSGVFRGFTFNSGGTVPQILNPLMSNITILNNDILSSGQGVFLRNLHSTEPNGPVHFNNVKVNENSLDRNAPNAHPAFQADAGLTINDVQIKGKRNWYGSAVYADVDARVDGSIDFLPYLVDGDDEDLMSSCFEPDPTADIGCDDAGRLVRNESTNVTYCFIQEAIDDVLTLTNHRLKIKTGTYVGNVDAATGGKNIKFAPGNSPGCVTINGNYTLNAGDVLEMEIEGTTACTQYDQFIVNGVVTLNGATLTLIPSMFFAMDGDVITLINNDGTDAVVGKFAQGNFATDGQNMYYIDYKGGDGNDVVLTKCCGALVDLGIFTTIVAPVDNPPMQKDVLAGHKLVIRAKPTKDMVNAIYTQGTFTIRTPTNIGLINFAGDNVHSTFGYTQIGMKQTIGGYDYFVFNFENGNPAPLNWLKGVEYDLVTLTYSCAVGAQMFELVTNPTDPNAPVSGQFYQEINGETDPGAQGVFYEVSATGPAVLAISATSNSPVCETMEIDLNSTTSGGSLNYAPYAWSGPSMYTSALANPIPFTATLAPPTAGVYTVSVTEGNGCTATGTTTVVVPATGACVKNEDTNLYYPTITQAIDANETDDLDVLTVPSGNWPENVVVDKDLTINGANSAIPCTDTRNPESIIKGFAGTGVTITSDGVTIAGFQIEANTGISSTLNDGVTLINNKVFAAAVGIGSTGVSTASVEHTIEDNCVDMTSHVFADFTFSSNPALATTQAPPGAWYTDRYAPFSFTAATLGGSSRLKHTIDASNCATCRPPAFLDGFYNTQGRKFDITGATSMSIQLYVPSEWETTGRRMAGFWGTAVNAGNAISSYPIVEFTSDGSNPRFRIWNNGVWIDKGLPGGFVYNTWVSLTIAIVGADFVFTIGDLTETIPGLGSVSLANVILQGHNTLAGVTYDIHWDNFSSNSPLVVNTNTPSVGIALVGASGANDVIIRDNSVADAFYGYLLNAVTTTDRTTVRGGDPDITHTNLMQGVSVTNSLTGGAPYAPSTVGVEDLKLESFGGDYPHLPAVNFHAGVYVFTGGSNVADKVDILIDGITAKNTGKTSQASAGLYFADFSTGAGNRLDAEVTLSTIENNKNRGVQVRGINATATVNTSHILGNGADPFGAGGNHGFGVYAGVGSTVTLNNNFIANPLVQVSDNVTALFEGVAPASTIIAGSNSIVRNGNGLLAKTTTGTIDGATNCNWWGSALPNEFDEFIQGAVTYAPYLDSGVDLDDPNAANGFQPSVSCLGLTDFYVNDDVYLMGTDLITFAVGLDAPGTRGTAHRPYRHINAAIGAATSGAGHTIRVDVGNYNDEQVLVNKGVTILGTTGAPAVRPVVDYTGAVSGKPTLFDVSADGVTIDNIGFNVNLATLRSAIIVSGVTIDNVVINNNDIDAYGTPGGSYGDRNAVSVNYTGATNYRVAAGGVNSVTFTGNNVSGTMPSAYFRSGISADEIGGTFNNNILQTINHDVLLRFASNGNVTVSGNTFNGGGLELAEHNAGAGTFTVTNNTFDGTGANFVTPRTAVLRLKNNQQNKATTVSGNTLNNALWGMSLENYKNVTVDNNTLTPLAGSTDFLHVGVNTKLINSNSNTIMQTQINGTFTNNVFNGSGVAGGTGIAFFNHDSDADDIGTFTVGTLGNENEFNSNIAVFAHLDDQLGSTDPATFPTNYPDGGGWLTTMACWDKDVDLTNNTFDVGAGQQLPLDMNNTQRVALEAKLYHKPDNSCLGKFFQTVEVMAKVFLQGPYDPADGPNGKMIDALRTLSDFPLEQPHADIEDDFPGSFAEVSNAGTETILDVVLDEDHADNAIVDWIWLELRDKNNHNTTLFTRSALVQRDGDIVDLDGTSEVAFPNAYQDQYYLMVRHRNHLAAMTAAPINFSNPPMVDFTTAAQATFGTTPTSARRLIKTGIFGLWAGNTYHKDHPDNGGSFRLLYNGGSNDRLPILTRVGNSTPLNVVDGYYIEDVNMNGQVKYSGSNNDRVIILNNVGASTPLNSITQQPNN